MVGKTAWLFSLTVFASAMQSGVEVYDPVAILHVPGEVKEHCVLAEVREFSEKKGLTLEDISEVISKFAEEKVTHLILKSQNGLHIRASNMTDDGRLNVMIYQTRAKIDWRPLWSELTTQLQMRCSVGKDSED